MATEINAGRVAMVPKGEWSLSTAYVRLDVVSYHGSSYVCKEDCTGQNPSTATTYWQLLSSGLDPTVDTLAAKHYEGSTLTAETSISAAGVISKTASGVTKTFNLPAESGTLALASQVEAKQDTLVSGTNIKTVNGVSVVGSGDVSTTLVATVTESNGAYTSDKLFSELNAAFNAGISVYASYMGVRVPMVASSVSTHTALFYGTLDGDAANITIGNMADEVYVTITSKQDTLVPGTSIKNINGASLLDAGNIDVALKDETLPNKTYAPAEFSGLGRKYLQKNIVDVSGTDKNVLTQAMFQDGSGNALTNTIFVIQYDYDLNEQSITIPSGCTLQFDGGNIKNGTIVANNATIEAGLVQIFSTDVTISGVFNVIEGYPEWFGAKSGQDCTDAIQKCVNSFTTTHLQASSEYYVSSPIRITGARNIIGDRVASTDNKSTIRVNSFTPTTVNSKSVSAIFYGYQAGDYLRIDNVFASGAYKVASFIDGSLGSFHLEVTNCYIVRFFGAAIYLGSSDKSIVDNNYLLYNYVAVCGSSIEFDILTEPLTSSGTSRGACNNVIITRNDIGHNEFGVIIKTSSNVIINDNLIGYTSANPIHVTNTKTVIVDNNYFEGDFSLQFDIVEGQNADPVVTQGINTCSADAEARRVANTFDYARARALVFTLGNSNVHIGTSHISIWFLRNYKGLAYNTTSTVGGLDCLYSCVYGTIKIEKPGVNEHTKINGTSVYYQYDLISLILGTLDAYPNIKIKDYNYIDYEINGVDKINAHVVNSSFISPTYYLNSSDVEVSSNIRSGGNKGAIFKNGELYLNMQYEVQHSVRIPVSALKADATYIVERNILANAAVTSTNIRFDAFMDTRSTNLFPAASKTCSFAAGQVIKVSRLIDTNGLTGTYIYFQVAASSQYSDLFFSPWKIYEVGANDIAKDDALISISQDGYQVVYAPTMFGSDGYSFNGITWNDTTHCWYDGEGRRRSASSTSLAYLGIFKVVGTTDQRPSSLASGDKGYQYWDTTLGKMIAWNGSAWVNLDGTALS